MRMIIKRLSILLLLVAMIVLPGKASAQIYADVSVGGAVSGTFRINLFYQQTPATVANFIGLATGKKAWLDYKTGNLVNLPFYNGVTFHRVIAGFVSQTGSRKGDGTDGPGYTFRNEITPLLTNTTYTVSMANSGVDTNGAQWYITSGSINAANIQGLNGNYTIFGQVISGTSVCDAINAVPTSGAAGTPADNPLTPVYINSIKFSGSSLASFNLTPNALPVVLSANPAMQVSGNSYTIAYDHDPYSYYIGYSSPDLSNWTQWVNHYFATTAPSAGNADVTSIVTGSEKYFFRIARVDYSKCYNPYVPNSVSGKVLTFNNIFPYNGVGVLRVDMTTNSWTWNGGEVVSLGYGSSYDPLPYWGSLNLNLNFPAANPTTITFTNLYYTSGTLGTFTGYTNSNTYSTVSGTFTSTP